MEMAELFERLLMNAVNLKAHFDGEKILLDEPFDIEADTKLIVTVLPRQIGDEQEDWMVVSQKGLERAYGENEPEYSMDLIKEANPDYEGK